MPIGADASPLILLARAGYLDLLRELYLQVWIPPSVADESFRDVPTRPGAAALAAIADDWLQEVVPTDDALTESLLHEVDAGEAAAISLAVEHGLLLLIDDRDGRRVANTMAVRIIGTAGVLMDAKRAGLLPEIRPALDSLRAEGLRLSAVLYQRILADAGE